MKPLGSVTLCAMLASACGSVGQGPASDASTTDDAGMCFGSSRFAICLASAPTQPLTISSPITLDTTSSPLCSAFIGDGNYCVVAATRLAIDAGVRATGARPLVLLASDSIVIAAGATVDVGSRRARPTGAPETGAGADPAACDLGTGVDGFSSGGGAGGSFAGRGGPGGSSSGGAVGGTPGGVAGAITVLRGGCPGQSGAAELSSGPGGHGGGAVFLIAGTTIEVAGSINAGGEGGGGRATAGGGGGGSGGLIGFDAPMVTVTGTLVANGGGGGEGADGTGQASARDGADATAITEAVGRAGGVPTGGDGGNGSAGAIGGPGKAGGVGTTGGAGGGGAGLILVPVTANLTFAQVSPMAAPLPE
jgi:hypothetical protein